MFKPCSGNKSLRNGGPWPHQQQLIDAATYRQGADIAKVPGGQRHQIKCNSKTCGPLDPTPGPARTVQGDPQ